MTTLDETREHWFSVDSEVDLSTADLDLSTDETTWETATHTTPPAWASTLPNPEPGLTRYWWRILIGPDGGLLTLTDETTEVYGRVSVGAETLRPSWTIYAEGDPEPDPLCWPVIACDDSTWTSHTAEVQRRAEHRATATLRMLTGYRVGGCPVLLRPGPRASCPHRDRYRTYPAYGTGSLLPSLSCGCPGPSAYRLPGEPTGVDEVKVDGVTLTEGDDYRFLDGILYRADGETWPTTQNLAAADTEAGTWSILYNPHAAPDEQAQAAAGVLACEYAKADVGKACALPTGARQIVRAGVTIDLVAETFPDGLTGIAAVDAFIRRWNPYRQAIMPQGIDPALYVR